MEIGTVHRVHHVVNGVAVVTAPERGAEETAVSIVREFFR